MDTTTSDVANDPAAAGGADAALARDLMVLCRHILRPPATLAAFERLDLSFTQVKALAAAADGELTVKELAERLGLSLPGTSRAVDVLVRRGLFDRREDDRDRRMKRVSITDEGRGFLRTIDEARLQGLEAFVRDLAPEHRERLAATLRPIIDDLET